MVRSPRLVYAIAIALWATNLLPAYLTSLLFFAAVIEARIGGFASYVELLSCLEMAGNVRGADNQELKR
jgi:hypothetical protein